MSATLNAFDPRFSEAATRIRSLGLIVLAHIGVFYALLSGLEHVPVNHAPPKEVIATFITPEPARTPLPPRPEPAPVRPTAVQPKPVAAVKKPVTREKPVPKIEETTPSPTAIAAPQPAPAAAEPATPAPSAPPAPPAPTPAAAPAAPPMPKTVTSGIEYVQAPRPEYPPAARRSGEEGKTVLRVLVNDRGRPERIEVQKSSGYERLDEAARQAAARAVFKPFTEDGKAVAAFAIVPVNFQLD